MSLNVACQRPWVRFEVINEQGDVKPCRWGSVVCGNVKTQSPEEIWEGPGFQLYRLTMKRGQTDITCPRACPRLNGSTESEMPQTARSLGRPSQIRLTTEGLTIGESIEQIDSGLLPSQIHEWINTARQVTIEGHDPFSSGIFSALDPTFRRRRDLSLSVITDCLPTEIVKHPTTLRNVLMFLNDQGSADSKRERFDEAVRELRQLRSRDGNVRMTLGFRIRNNNLRKGIELLDFCSQLKANPQYFLLRNDFGQPGSFTDGEAKTYGPILNSLDKELWARGWSSYPLLLALAQFRHHSRQSSLHRLEWPQMVFGDFSPAAPNQILRAVSRSTDSQRSATIGLQSQLSETEDLNKRLTGHISAGHVIRAYGNGANSITSIPSEVELNLSKMKSGEALECYLKRVESELEKLPTKNKHLTITASLKLRENWGTVENHLRHFRMTTCSFTLPFWMSGQPVSVLEWVDMVAKVRLLCTHRGWKLDGGRPDLLSVGLDISGQYPEIADVHRRNLHDSVDLTVLAPVYNRADQLTSFVESVVHNDVKSSVEFIIIDDGSTDDSWELMIRASHSMPRRMDFTLIKLHRKTPYIPNSFTFRAGAARQVGLEFARSNRIVFFDPDQTIDEKCLSEHLHSGKMGFDVVLGVRSYPDYSLMERLRIRMRHLSSVQSFQHWWGWFFTGNASVSRRALDIAGGFDEVLQFWGLDDMDLGYRLERSGARFWHSPRARVQHLPGVASGGGASQEDRAKSCRFQMEVLYRKYLDDEILATYRRFWQ